MALVAVPPRTTTRPPPRAGRAPVLAAPALVWYALFMVGPVLAVFVISFLGWTGMLSKPTFAGFDNYRAVFTDPVFADAVRNTLWQVLVAVPVMVVAACLLGTYVHLRPRGGKLLRYLLFIPGLVSTAAKAMLCYAVLSPDGLLNGFLGGLGFADDRAWLADPATALGCLIALDVWAGAGFTAVLLAARLDAIDPEVEEAARLDGAGAWRSMWRVQLPIVREFVGVLTMLQFLWTLFGSAQNVLLLTQGGPGTATTTLSYLVYSKAFVEADLGYSQAVGAVLFVVGLAGMLVVRRVLNSTTN